MGSTKTYTLMSRSEDEARQNLPRLTFVDEDCLDNWLTIEGADLFDREKEGKLSTGRKYKITIEEL